MGGDRQNPGVGLISEREVIEQVMDEPRGRSVRFLLDLASPESKDQLLRLLEGMWRTGKILLLDSSGDVVANWEAEAFFGLRSGCGDMSVVATEVGLDNAFGQGDGASS